MLDWDEPQLTPEQIVERFKKVFGREMTPAEERSLLLDPTAPCENQTIRPSKEPLMRNGDIVRILVVDDFEPWRREVCAMLQRRPEFCVVAEVADGLEAVQEADKLKPDLILLDIGLPSLNGLEVANRIRQSTPDARIIFLTQMSDSDVIRAALSTGAQGYVVKANAWADLFAAIDGAESASTTA